MTIFRKAIPAFLIALAACFCCTAAAEDAVKEFRIGLIGADPGQLLQDFDPFVEYLKSDLRSSGIQDVTVFVARDLDQMRGRIQKGRLDFVFTSAFPLIEMERQNLIPAVVALRGDARDDRAVFFVREKSTLRHLGDLRGKIVAFGTPWSTAGYALAKAELKKIKVPMREWTDEDAPEDAVRYRFAGEPVNQAFRVIRHRVDAGVISSSDWDALSPKERSRLRIIHRTAPVTRLVGSFHPLFPPVLREVVAQALVDMSENGKGRDALTRALNMTSFDRLTEEDRNSLLGLKKQLREAN